MVEGLTLNALDPSEPPAVLAKLIADETIGLASLVAESARVAATL
jgi:hypothetical protein